MGISGAAIMLMQSTASTTLVAAVNAAVTADTMARSFYIHHE